MKLCEHERGIEMRDDDARRGRVRARLLNENNKLNGWNVWEREGEPPFLPIIYYFNSRNTVRTLSNVMR